MLLYYVIRHHTDEMSVRQGAPSPVAIACSCAEMAAARPVLLIYFQVAVREDGTSSRAVLVRCHPVLLQAVDE